MRGSLKTVAGAAGGGSVGVRKSIEGCGMIGYTPDTATDEIESPSVSLPHPMPSRKIPHSFSYN